MEKAFVRCIVAKSRPLYLEYSVLYWAFFLFKEINRLVHYVLRKNSELVTLISFVDTFRIYTGKSQLNLKVSIFVLTKKLCT